MGGLNLQQDLSKDQFVSVTRDKYKAALAKSQPLYAWFSITEKCDLRCKLCFADSGKPLDNELTTQEVKAIIDNIADSGTKAIVFGGGEPLVREDLLEIISYTSRYMAVSINTNGFSLTPDYAWDLREAGAFQVKVSVDGLKSTHDWNRGKGSFERAISAIKNCREAGINSVVMIPTVHKTNLREIPDLTAMAMDLGAIFTIVEFLPLGRGRNHKDLMLSPEQTRELQFYLLEARKKYGAHKILFENRCLITEEKELLKTCGDPDQSDGFCLGCAYGIFQYCINATGHVVAADVLTLEAGDLKKESLRDIWHNSKLLKQERDRDNLKGKCGRCEYKFVCGGCRRRAYALTGDFMAADPGCWRK